jgi:hypothetical protein
VAQLGGHRLDHDFLGVKHLVDHDSEHLGADLGHHDKAVVAHRLVAIQLQKTAQADERQQLVAQAKHCGVLDALDAML